ncbi:adenylate cyclase, class 2 [Proteiniborus ethanoligenes]|uniref:Adenylate cyclase, class 2 n=1 Tax=Proteiniborus ethanoligenes TaxID=415015 RepID=A0A1H3P749_9FIRM|nr:class IV adenylate cyclase [Proteiniborus ethanoligenes]TAH61572.1 MAG: CYTH domain-containing protein [Gottschalkiaceae bacterium]SDY96793.1 adenylate cyclase, class 2 [Proteiniborus ethanoligenes]
MAKELEVKVLNIDKGAIEEKLQNIGARLISKEYQINTLYDSENKTIENLGDGYLRIRETRNLLTDEVEILFTLKKNISSEIARENMEIETRVWDKAALNTILKHLNLNVIHEGTKERISYVFEDIRFDIDTWDVNTYPYPYLEIEVLKKEDIQKAVELLKIEARNVTTKSLRELRAELNLDKI